jgi:hypothetical protein
MIGVQIASLYEVISFSISVRATRAECDSVRRYGCLGQVREKKKKKRKKRGMQHAEIFLQCVVGAAGS